MQHNNSNVNGSQGGIDYVAPEAAAITRADSAINQFLNMSAARMQNNNNNNPVEATQPQTEQGNQIAEGLTEGSKDGYDLSTQMNQPPQGGILIEGLVEGTKTNFGLAWTPNSRVHGQNQARDMMQVKELIAELKYTSNQLVIELGKFPGSSPVIESSRKELEETCKRLIQSLGIVETTETPEVGNDGQNSQNTAWLIDFWKIKYKEVADKYNKLIITVKQKIMHGQMTAPIPQQQQQQLQNQHSLAYMAQQPPIKNNVAPPYIIKDITPATNVNLGGGSDQVIHRTSSMQATAPSFNPSYIHSPVQMSPSPIVNAMGIPTTNAMSTGPTPPETPRSTQAHSRDLPPDSAILFVGGVPQQQQGQPPSKVNVIRCDRVRPVPVKDRGVKIGKQEDFPIPAINTNLAMTEEEKKLVQMQEQHHPPGTGHAQEDTIMPQLNNNNDNDYVINNISIDNINIDGVLGKQAQKQNKNTNNNKNQPSSYQPQSARQQNQINVKPQQNQGGKTGQKNQGGGSSENGGQSGEGSRRSRRSRRYNNNKGQKNNNNNNNSNNNSNHGSGNTNMKAKNGNN